MNQILDAVMQSLDNLHDTCSCTKFMLPHGSNDIVITVPRTRRGRELYRSLLLEVARIEREKGEKI